MRRATPERRGDRTHGRTDEQSDGRTGNQSDGRTNDFSPNGRTAPASSPTVTIKGCPTAAPMIRPTEAPTEAPTTAPTAAPTAAQPRCKSRVGVERQIIPTLILRSGDTGDRSYRPNWPDFRLY